MTIKALRLALATTIVVLATAATAFAQSPADTVYNTNGGVLNVVSGGGKTPPGSDTPSGTAGGTATTTVTRETGASTPAATSTGSLPFTGFQAGLVAAAGIALLGAGVAMRRAARPEA